MFISRLSHFGLHNSDIYKKKLQILIKSKKKKIIRKMKNLILLLLFSFIISSKLDCKGYEYYDENEKKCIAVCEESEYFNEITNTCEYCPIGEYIDEVTFECYPKCKEDEIYNPKTDKCDNIPECGKNEFYNFDSGKCEKSEKKNCLDDEIWDDLKKFV